MTSRLATTLNDLPNKPCWVIMTGDSTHVPGDERSRTLPGHGYPGYTSYHLNVYVYEKEEEWRSAIADRAKRGDKGFKAFAMIPAQIETHVEVSVRV